MTTAALLIFLAQAHAARVDVHAREASKLVNDARSPRVLDEVLVRVHPGPGPRPYIRNRPPLDQATFGAAPGTSSGYRKSGSDSPSFDRDKEDVIAGRADIAACDVVGGIGKELAARTVSFNGGAYEDCLRDLRNAGKSRSVQRLKILAVIDEHGRFRTERIVVNGLRNTIIGHCFSQAIDQLWTEPAVPAKATSVVIPFVVSWKPAGHGQPSYSPECKDHLNAIHLAMQAAPWLEDPSVASAITALAWRVDLEPIESLGRRCWNEAATDISHLALVPHTTAQGLKRASTLHRAANAYRWIRALPVPLPNAADMSFYEGEALWVLERWRDAARAYARVVQAPTESKFRADAAYGCVLALRNAFGLTDDEATSVRLEAQLSSDDARELLNAYAFHLQLSPGTQNQSIITPSRRRLEAQLAQSNGW